jgi:hypothetical protein
MAKLEINALSDTRWACRYNSVRIVLTIYDAIIQALHELKNGNSSFKFQAFGLI